MEIKEIKDFQMKEALELVWKVFLEFEAPDYTKEGIAEFKKTIDDKTWIEKRKFLGAFDDDKIVGVIATFETSHIALLFVDGNYHRKGIGRKLFETVKKQNYKGFFTVNSSPYAHDVYKHFGFCDTDTEQVVKGLRFIPMKLELR